jgi:hypothetical protein
MLRYMYIACLVLHVQLKLRFKYISNTERSTELTVKLIGLFLTDANNASEQFDWQLRYATDKVNVE